MQYAASTSVDDGMAEPADHVSLSSKDKDPLWLSSTQDGPVAQVVRAHA